MYSTVVVLVLEDLKEQQRGDHDIGWRRRCGVDPGNEEYVINQSV